MWTRLLYEFIRIPLLHDFLDLSEHLAEEELPEECCETILKGLIGILLADYFELGGVHGQ